MHRKTKDFMKTARNLVGLAALAMAVSSFAADGPTLVVGSPAPAIKVVKWAKGTPVAGFEKGKTYVVEFWATWCGPCKQTIPHLSELAKKFAGKVTFVGVDAFEHEPDETKNIPQVEKFVKDFGDKMSYNVAIDGKEGTMGKTWMVAAQQQGIPTAFVIDGTGKVAWIGHPMALDEPLGKIVDGTFDAKAEAERVAKLQAAEAAAHAAQQAEVDTFLKPYRAKKFAEAVAVIDKLIIAKPATEENYGMVKFLALAQSDPAGASAYAHKLESGIYKAEPIRFAQMAAAELTPGSPIQNPDVKLSIELLEFALANIKPTEQAKPSMLDLLASAYAKQGDMAKAAKTEEDAIAALAGIPNVPDAVKAKFNENLATYKKPKKP